MDHMTTKVKGWDTKHWSKIDIHYAENSMTGVRTNLLTGLIFAHVSSVFYVLWHSFSYLASESISSSSQADLACKWNNFIFSFSPHTFYHPLSVASCLSPFHFAHVSFSFLFPLMWAVAELCGCRLMDGPVSVMRAVSRADGAEEILSTLTELCIRLQSRDTLLLIFFFLATML